HVPDDPPEIANARTAECYYIRYHPPGPHHAWHDGGVALTLRAATFLAERTLGPMRWDDCTWLCGGGCAPMHMPGVARPTPSSDPRVADLPGFPALRRQLQALRSQLPARVRCRLLERSVDAVLFAHGTGRFAGLHCAMDRSRSHFQGLSGGAAR